MGKLEKLYDRTGSKWAHPELAEAYDGLSAGESGSYETYLNTKDFSFEERKAMADAVIEATKLAYPPIECKTYMVKGCEEEPETEVKMEVLYPEKRTKKKLSCLYAISGGGLCFCITSVVFETMKKFANEFGCVVATVNYRTIFNGGGYPQTVNDCHAGYKWLVENASELGINSDKIVLWGMSSGSHLSLALSHRLKKYNYYGCKPRGCVVTATITEDRTHFPSNKLYIKNGWNATDNDASARLWLGRTDYSHIPAEAFPNHATAEECIGLPPTFIHADEHDPCSDSSSEYVSKLVQAGVYTEFHRWGGSFHGVAALATVSDTEYGKRFNEVFYGNMKDCFKYDLRRSWIDAEEEKNMICHF